MSNIDFFLLWCHSSSFFVHILQIPRRESIIVNRLIRMQSLRVLELQLPEAFKNNEEVACYSPELFFKLSWSTFAAFSINNNGLVFFTMYGKPF